MLNHEKNNQKVFKNEPFKNEYDWKGINFPTISQQFLLKFCLLKGKKMFTKKMLPFKT